MTIVKSQNLQSNEISIKERVIREVHSDQKQYVMDTNLSSILKFHVDIFEAFTYFSFYNS